MKNILSRRQFLVGASAISCSSPVIPQTREAQSFRVGTCIGARQEDMFWKVCDECARVGFRYVETSGSNFKLVDNYVARSEALKGEFEKRKLTPIGFAQYSPMSDPAKRKELVEQHLSIGRLIRPLGGRYITHLLIPPPKPGVPEEKLFSSMTKEDLQNWATNLNEVGKQLRDETGIRIGYHPEQADAAAGLIDAVMELTDERYFGLVPDVGHITAVGLDPPAIYKRYGSRIITTHFRDFDPKSEFERNGTRVKGRFVPLGEGIIDHRGLVGFLRQIKFTGQIMAEGGNLASNHQFLAQKLSLAL